MTERIFIVTNDDGLLVRSKPDTRTGAVMRKMTNGEGFQAFDVFTLRNQTWARVSRGDSISQEYACIAIGNRIFARQQEQPYQSPSPNTAFSAWVQAVDDYLRAQGYTGPRP